MSTTYESMIVRFKGLTKAEMIAKYNKNAWGWGTLDKRNAELAIKQLLSGNVPNEKIVKTIEEVISEFPETIVVKPETKTEEQIFQEDLLGKDDHLPEGPPVDDDLMDLSGLKPETRGIIPVSPNPVSNAPKKAGRPKRAAGSVKE